MSAAPYHGLGVGENGFAFTSNASPVGPAKQRYLRENGVTSSVMTFDDNTTVVEVAAQTAPAYIRWIARTDTQASVVAVAGTANFDDVIPANTTRVFPIPQEIQGTASIVGANIANGLYNRMAVRTAVAASVVTIEF